MSIEVEAKESTRYLPWVRIASRGQWLQEHTELVDRYRQYIGPDLSTDLVEKWVSPRCLEFPVLWHHELKRENGRVYLEYFFVFPSDARRLFAS